ncbi:MAG: divalent metal cation transporter, partial [Rhodothermales bacterium]
MSITPDFDLPDDPEGGLKGLLTKTIAFIGPGLFVLGYTIGTGSVTTMATSGAAYGMTLTWAVALSCLFTFFLIVGISRLTIVRDQPFISAVRDRFGRTLALFLVVSLMLTVVTSVMGISAIVGEAVQAWTQVLGIGEAGVPSLVIGFILAGLLYALFWTGSHGLFLKAAAVVVGIMGACFILTTLIIVSQPQAILESLPPAIPPGNEGHLILAGMVGTTMASVVIVARSYLVDAQGWRMADLKTERRDAALSLFLTFVVSAAIMASAAGTMFPAGLRVESAIDMVQTIEPLAGDFAAGIFVVGLVAAGLSSLFPGYVLGPWLLLDYLDQPRDLTKTWVRVFVLVIAAMGLVVPLFGGRPVVIMIASQAVSPVVMPLMIGIILYMLNTKHAETYRNARWLNAGLVV